MVMHSTVYNYTALAYARNDVYMSVLVLETIKDFFVLKDNLNKSPPMHTFPTAAQADATIAPPDTAVFL